MQVRRAWLLSLMVAFSLAAACRAQGPTPLRAELQRRDRFRVVDILVFRNRPKLTDFSMLAGYGSGAFWSSGHPEDGLDEVAFRREIARYKDFPGVFYIDIENWPTCYAPAAVIEQSMAKFARVIALVREIAPRLTFGIYNEIPAFGYWPIVGSDKGRLEEWKACNQRMATLASGVDLIFPSLYTFYDDEAGWDAYAKATLEAAKQYGKPVYAFLWPEYHESNPVLGGKSIPGRVWRHELEIVRQHADGVVLWSGLNRQWDGNADWWRETRSFVQSLPP